MTVRRRLLIWAGILLLAAVVAFVLPRLAERTIPSLPEKPSGGDFTLQSSDGPVSLAAQSGKVTLVFFGYTYCPDICPTSLASTTAGLKRLTLDELARVSVIFISVDPERDTPARLKEYVTFFHPAILGVTGTADQVAEVARRYGAFYQRQNAATAGGNYVIDHTATTYVVAPDGVLRDEIPHAAPPDEVAAKIRRYLKP